MSRSLASIQRIVRIDQIPDADAIEVVTVLGWQVVVKKDLNYKPGDFVVFFEIDSVLPNLPVFEEMLYGKPYSTRAARLKSKRFRGQVSQGYVRHVADLPQIPDAAIEEGFDVTELLGVVKYEKPETGEQVANTSYWLSPHVPRTDEDRVQSKPKLVDKIQGQPYVITIKLDGQSGTFGLDDDGVYWVCSRNFRLKPGRGGTYDAVSERYKLPALIETYPELVIQGEVCGPGIQGNRLGLSEPDLFVFNIFDRSTNSYFAHDALRVFCEQVGLRPVPVFEAGYSFRYTPDELLRMAEGKYESGREREGIVIRHRYQTGTDRISFKAISNAYLFDGGN